MGIEPVMQHQQGVALITGASSGIGKATASLLATSGFRVFGTSRKPEAETGQPYELVPLDVRSDASVHSAVQSILDRAGRIDLLVNNAGYPQAGAIEENSVADVQAQFDTNVFGVLRVTNAVLPIMRRQRSGRIINVSSLLGQVAPPFLGVYASSKFALEGLSEALRRELRPFNIHVSLIEPAFAHTSFVGQGPSQPIADYDAARRAVLAFARQGVERGMDATDVAQQSVIFHHTSHMCASAVMSVPRAAPTRVFLMRLAVACGWRPNTVPMRSAWSVRWWITCARTWFRSARGIVAE